jgi:hypothetical protein
MPDPTAPRNRWRSPLFLFVFAPGAAAWLAVIVWLVWLNFDPVRAWVGRQHEPIQELLTFLILVVVVGIAIGVFTVVLGIADRVAGIPPPVPAPGQKYGRHAKWTPPH